MATYSVQCDWLARIMARVEVQPNGCWLWHGGKTKAGYGQVYVAGKNRRVHRAVYEAMVGPIPPGLFLCHHCDRPACVNPEHLYIGTPLDNSRDRVRRSRSACGECNGAYTHPERRPRGKRNGANTQPERHPHGDNHYSRLQPEKLSRGDSHYSRIRPQVLARGERHGRAKLTEAKVQAIRELRKRGETLSALATRFEVCQTTIRKIVHNETWGHITGKTSDWPDAA